MFTEAFEDLLRGHCDPAVVRTIEAGGAHAPLWNAITESGFLELMAPEEAGGAALDLAGALPLFTALGAHAVPLPVGQAIALRTLLPAGMPAPRACPPSHPRCGARRTTPWSRHGFPTAPWPTTCWPNTTVRCGCWTPAPRTAKAAAWHRDATADLRWPAAVWATAARALPGAAPAESLSAWGTALHAALLTGALVRWCAGALVRSFELTLQYGNVRVQFGRSIGKFQAIQHQLSVMAGHATAARMATAGAFAAGRTVPAALPAAVAKARTSEAVTVTAAIAHAVHGAIGITEEYNLQLLTRRLHAWRRAHGSEAHWQRVIGEALLDACPARAADFVRTLQAA